MSAAGARATDECARPCIRRALLNLLQVAYWCCSTYLYEGVAVDSLLLALYPERTERLIDPRYQPGQCYALYDRLFAEPYAVLAELDTEVIAQTAQGYTHPHARERACPYRPCVRARLPPVPQTLSAHASLWWCLRCAVC